ncbi:MAG: hypothetical protein ACRD18_04645 [Terriglobia bacterium]
MRLLAKFNLLLIIVFGVGITIAAIIAHGFLERNARYSTRFKGHRVQNIPPMAPPNQDGQAGKPINHNHIAEVWILMHTYKYENR